MDDTLSLKMYFLFLEEEAEQQMPLFYSEKETQRLFMPGSLHYVRHNLWTSGCGINLSQERLSWEKARRDTKRDQANKETLDPLFVSIKRKKELFSGSKKSFVSLSPSFILLRISCDDHSCPHDFTQESDREDALFLRVFLNILFGLAKLSVWL